MENLTKWEIEVIENLLEDYLQQWDMTNYNYEELYNIRKKLLWKKYIKITKEVTEEKAIKKLEELWGKPFNNLFIEYKSNWILKLYNTWNIYYTNVSEEDLKENWYEEIVLTPSFELWEQIAVSNASEERAIDDLNRDTYKFYYTWWKTKSWKYIVEVNDWIINDYKYIAKIPKEKQKQETIKIGDNTYNKKEFEECIANLKSL